MIVSLCLVKLSSTSSSNLVHKDLNSSQFIPVKLGCKAAKSTIKVSNTRGISSLSLTRDEKAADLMTSRAFVVA